MIKNSLEHKGTWTIQDLCTKDIEWCKNDCEEWNPTTAWAA